MMRLTLKSKVLLLAMVPVLLFALVLSGGAVLILKKQADAEVKDTRERLLGDRRAELEHYVQIAMGSIQAEYDRSANGDLNARAEAIARLSKVKYGKDGYIFGYDSQVVRLFRGDSPVDVGKSFRDRRDPSGVYLNRELVEAGKNGSHYVTYTSPLPGNESVMVPKLSYTLYLPKWDMVIGSAINLDGVEAQLVEIKQAIDERIGTLIASIVAIAGVLLVVLLVIGLAVANAMLRPLHQIRQNLDDIAAGEGDLTRRLPVTSYDELGELAGSFNRFVEKIHGLVRQIAGMTGDLKQLVEQMSAQAERSEQAMERQRHETDQVATAINEMSAAAHEVAQSAQRAA
ncbi:HAMP domain-containing protein, partial [Pseudomonas aeruginosa]|nr:HAMP domain-containing protein [Pseudomonas aeruginosa]